MSSAAAVAFLERVEQDEAFAAALASVRSDPARVLATVRAGGYDIPEDEITQALLDRYGIELTQEQLDAVAAGLSVADSAAIGAAAVAVAIGLASAGVGAADAAA